MALFVVAAIFALFTNWPVNYHWVSPENVRESLRRKPPPTEQRALQDIALTRLSVLEVARTNNHRKGQLLIAAMSFEVLAVIAVAVAIAIVIL